MMSDHVIYTQDGTEAINNTGARPGMSINIGDFSLTIDKVQVNDSDVFRCDISTGGQVLRGYTFLFVYSK